MRRIPTIHPFPARMAPSLAWNELKSHSKRPLRVLDPMAGSGTTLVIARSLGHKAIGFDTDPLAILIAEAWCSNLDSYLIMKKASEVHIRSERLYKTTKARAAFPKDADDETKEFIRYWFDRDARRQLFALATSIGRLQDDQVRKILWCAFSRLIITKSRGASLAMDLSHSRPHKVFEKAPIKPLNVFMSAISKILKNAPFCLEKKNAPTARFKLGDARHVPLKKNSVDVVITSPPYSNAIDYVRCHKFSLVWMGYKISDLRKLRSSNIGTEAIASKKNVLFEHRQCAIDAMGEINKLSNRNQGILKRYIVDMDLVTKEISRVLKPGGRAKLVVGNSSIRGVYVKNSDAIRALCKYHGLIHKSVNYRVIPANRRYLPPPSHSNSGKDLQSRMREEVILTFQAS